jgi:hypothetical protein
MHKPTRVAAAVAGAFAPMRLPEPQREPEQLQITVDHEGGNVVVRLSHILNGASFTPMEARQLAAHLVAHADAIDAAAATPAPAQPQPESV